MRPTALLVLALFVCACAPQAGLNADAGAEGGSAASTTPQVQGAGCGAESTTGATLCTAISLCPKVAVDHDVFPNCGFRIHGQAIDIECACSGALCPVGAPLTCDQAQQLLTGQTEAQVCNQVNEGRCTNAAPPQPSTSSTCDRACAGECGGDPGCLKSCGC